MSQIWNVMDPEFKEETLYKYTLNLKVAVRETGLLLVIRSLGIRDLRTSLPLICESIDQDTAKSNFQAVECKIKRGWFNIAVALSD